MCRMFVLSRIENTMMIWAFAIRTISKGDGDDKV